MKKLFDDEFGAGRFEVDVVEDLAAPGAYDEACKGALRLVGERAQLTKKEKASVGSRTSLRSSRSVANQRKSSTPSSLEPSPSSAPPPPLPPSSALSSLPHPALERCPRLTSRGSNWTRAVGTRRARFWRGSWIWITRASRGTSTERARLKARGPPGSSWRRRRCVFAAVPAKGGC